MARRAASLRRRPVTELFEGLAKTTPAGRVGHAAYVAQAIHSLATNGFVIGVVLDCTGGANLPTDR